MFLSVYKSHTSGTYTWRKLENKKPRDISKKSTNIYTSYLLSALRGSLLMEEATRALVVKLINIVHFRGATCIKHTLIHSFSLSLSSIFIYTPLSLSLLLLYRSPHPLFRLHPVPPPPPPEFRRALKKKEEDVAALSAL